MQKIEEALEQNRIALQSIVKHVPGGVFVYSAESDETFTFVSENMSMLGYTREEFDKKFDCRFSNMVRTKRIVSGFLRKFGGRLMPACILILVPIELKKRMESQVGSR